MTILQGILGLAALVNTALAVLVFLHTGAHRAGRGFAWYILALNAWILCVSSVQPHYADSWNLACIRGAFA
ncbi:MAG TPA: hypothetical protein PK794_08905, partial [Armatimonadota bacterium]|nr:hypothetical protein [Armatimonadota bacterium]